MRPSRPLVGRTAELEALALVSTAARPACGRSPSPASPASADPDIVSEAVSLAEYRAK